MNEHLARLQNVKSEDFIAIARFLAAMIPSCVMRARLKRRHAFFWLICEEAAEARDNGYVFFEYIKEHFRGRFCKALDLLSGGGCQYQLAEGREAERRGLLCAGGERAFKKPARLPSARGDVKQCRISALQEHKNAPVHRRGRAGICLYPRYVRISEGMGEILRALSF